MTFTRVQLSARFVVQCKPTVTRNKKMMFWGQIRVFWLNIGSCSWWDALLFRCVTITEAKDSIVSTKFSSDCSTTTAAASNACPGSRSFLEGELIRSTVFRATCSQVSKSSGLIDEKTTEMSLVSTRSVVSWHLLPLGNRDLRVLWIKSSLLRL